MAVTTTTSRVSYVGDGTTTVFAVPFYFLTNPDLNVYVGDTELSTGYTVSGAGNEAGGSVEIIPAPAASAQVVIVRNPDPLQQTRLPPNDPFPAQAVEDMADKLTMLVQRNGDLIGRALVLADTDVDGSGAYRAKQNRIQDLADPIENHDAVNLQTLTTAIAGIADGGAGLAVLSLLADASKSFGVSLVSGAIRVVNSIAELRTVLKTKNPKVLVTSYYGDGNGGGGEYFLDPTDTTSTDNGGSIIVADDGGRWKLVVRGGVTPEHFGAKGDGVTDDAPAFTKVASLFNLISGRPGSVYQLATQITLSAGNKIFNGNNATLRGTAAMTQIIVNGNDITFERWQVVGNGATVVFLNQGSRNLWQENRFTGDVGHYIMSISAVNTRVWANAFECENDSNVTTCVVFETCQFGIVSGNHFNGVPVGWSVQCRLSSQSITIHGNTFRQFFYQGTAITATAGQTVFTFTMSSTVNFKTVWVNGKPVSAGRTITNVGLTYTVTFSAGRSAGEVINLVGFRGAENIQINTSSFDITITGNVINGTGDSGIVVLGDRITIAGNTIKNAGYAGIALYGGQNNITITGNEIADCSLLDDGAASPDNPAIPSTFAGGIMISGSQVSVAGNVLINDSGTMTYGIRFNTVDNVDDGGVDKAVSIGQNSFRGTFPLGEYYFINGTPGKRIQSIQLDGMQLSYPEKPNIDSVWANAPANTSYIQYSGFGATIMVRDTTVTAGGAATMKTVAGEYLDMVLLGAERFRGCVVEAIITAKAQAGGSGYFSLLSTLSGGVAGQSIPISDSSAWRRYSVTLAYPPELTGLTLRLGGSAGAINVADIEFRGVRYK